MKALMVEEKVHITSKGASLMVQRFNTNFRPCHKLGVTLWRVDVQPGFPIHPGEELKAVAV